jgi:hypothetical protein
MSKRTVVEPTDLTFPFSWQAVFGIALEIVEEGWEVGRLLG